MELMWAVMFTGSKRRLAAKEPRSRGSPACSCRIETGAPSLLDEVLRRGRGERGRLSWQGRCGKVDWGDGFVALSTSFPSVMARKLVFSCYEGPEPEAITIGVERGIPESSEGDSRLLADG